MTREVVWVVAAEADAQNPFGWLLDHSPKAAQRLLKSFFEQMELVVAEFAELAPVWRAPIRRRVLPRTTFGLFYVIEPRRIIVVAVQDLRRDPKGLRKEIMGRLPR